MALILVVDDEPNIRWVFTRLLAEEGHEVRQAASGEEALAIAAEASPDLVFLDYRLGGMNGMETLRRLREAGLESPVIVITAYENVKEAVAVIKEGALDYLSKPLHNEEILVHARRALELDALRRRVHEQDRTVDRLLGIDDLVGGATLEPVLALARSVADADIPVLLSGESGTGKDLLARYIHRFGPRRDGPFVVLDCGAIPESLVESELFGYEKGAFTGAAKRTIGKFEAARGGTIFLDEVGNAPLSLQAKLLRIIETRSFSRLGSSALVKVDVRVLAASNRDLGRRSSQGEFRDDLYYRLKGVEIALPPLRDRREDLPRLVSHFLGRFAGQRHRPEPAITDGALAELCDYAWPGNIRELKNLMERLTLGHRTVIDVECLPAEIRSPAAPVSPAEAGGSLRSAREASLRGIEKKAVVEALERERGNKRAAARFLQVDPKTFYRLLHKYGIE